MRRLLVCALAVLVLLETGGVARAFGAASMIDCCCGVHSSARGCHCKDCPVQLRKVRTDLGAAQFAEARECAGGNDDAGVLSVLAVFPVLPVLQAPALLGKLPLHTVRVHQPRFVSPVRPPP